MRIGVLSVGCNPAVDVPGRYVSKTLAAKLIAQGKAVEVNRSRILLTMPMYNVPVQCGQGRIYTQLGAEKFPQVLQGGLTRTEHKPNAKPGILTWGHIGEK